MSAKPALLFPGQGSQTVGMGQAVAENFPAAMELFDQAQDVLGWDLKNVAWSDPNDELKQTDRTQPALYVTSAACFVVLKSKGILPATLAGHSVGEYAALYAAGVFDFQTGLRLVKARSDAMHKASVAYPGGMVAVLKLEEKDVREVCVQVQNESGKVVDVANLNSPGQIVISGENEALELAVNRVKERGTLKAIPLAVAGAWHSALMKAAEEELAPVIESTDFNDAQIPVYANITAKPVQSATDIKRLLVEQVCGAVRWADSVNCMIEDGASSFVECGNGKVLCGLMKRIDRTKKAHPGGTPDEIMTIEEAAKN
ncbi:MAG: ACP S-malonyltransferase [Candidatus Lindowbacteria bacterium]|nr:ACP S-malonyltransferase [Candidatus Lindowbacteria bacterium]